MLVNLPFPKPLYLNHGAKGFSLMEMAVVLMIMGILMSGVLVSVSQTTLNARRATALAQMRQIEDALYGFAQKQGRLPCPALATGTGLEEISGVNCTATHGFVPSASLGFDGAANDDGLLLDPWQNPYRYSVAWQSTPNFANASTGATSIKTFFSSSTAVSSTNMQRICSATACGATEILSDIAPAVILSMGEDWADTTSTSELDNANNTSTLIGAVTGNTYYVNSDLDFISAGYVEGTDGTADQFDDQLVWLSPYVLFNRMVSAGKLP